MRLSSSSEHEAEGNPQNEEIEIGLDGTVWTRIEAGGAAGRLPVHSTFEGVSGPTAHAKRNIMEGKKCIPVSHRQQYFGTY